MQAEPEEMAEVQTTALMMEGRTLIPAAWKAMTKGDESAVPVDFERALLSYGLWFVSPKVYRSWSRFDLHNHANNQDTQNVEEENSIKCLLCCIRDDLSRIRGLCS